MDLPGWPSTGPARRQRPPGLLLHNPDEIRQSEPGQGDARRPTEHWPDQTTTSPRAPPARPGRGLAERVGAGGRPAEQGAAQRDGGMWWWPRGWNWPASGKQLLLRPGGSGWVRMVWELVADLPLLRRRASDAGYAPTADPGHARRRRACDAPQPDGLLNSAVVLNCRCVGGRRPTRRARTAAPGTARRRPRLPSLALRGVRGEMRQRGRGDDPRGGEALRDDAPRNGGTRRDGGCVGWDSPTSDRPPGGYSGSVGV